MQRYKNLSGNSGVLAFETGPDYIIVQFNDGTYEYTARSTGAGNIRKMKQLAASGRGLNTFISRFVKKKYSRKTE